MKPAVQFEQVSKHYRLGTGLAGLRHLLTTSLPVASSRRNGSAHKADFWALREVSFSIPPGHALGLVGPNGAGKTTALKILARISEPTSGRVDVNGRTSALIELGAGFHPELTGRENIYLNAAILGLTRREVDRLFDRIVAFSGLERFIETPVKRYSSGMYVRLGFSVAAHVEPEVLLVDEVLSVGDAQFRQKCADRIEDLQRSGTTIVLVAHNLFLVKSICDLGLFLADGQVQADGDIVTAISAYETWLHARQAEAAQNGAASGASDGVDFQILDVNVARPGGDQTEEFNHADPAEISVRYRARRPVRRTNLILRIQRADGTTVCMIRASDYGYTLQDLEGEGCLSVVIDPIQLAGGAYSVDARLTGPIDGVPLAQGHSSWFQVSGLSISHVETSGVFVPRVAQVRQEKLGIAS